MTDNKEGSDYFQKGYVPKAPSHDGDGASYSPKAPTDSAPAPSPPPAPSKG